MAENYSNILPEERIKQLEQENSRLKTQNSKLHKDCVSFAKRLKKIQNSGILDEDVEGLKLANGQYQDEIASLREELDRLAQENRTLRVERIKGSSEDEASADDYQEDLEEFSGDAEEAAPDDYFEGHSDEAAAESAAVLPEEPAAVLPEEPAEALPEEPAEAVSSIRNVFFTKHPKTKKYGKAAKAYDQDAAENTAKSGMKWEDISSGAEEATQPLYPVYSEPADEADQEQQPDVYEPAWEEENLLPAETDAEALPAVRTTTSGVIRTISKVLAIILVVIAFISAICCIYARHPDASFLGSRAYTVSNENVSSVSSSDIIFVRKTDMSKLTASSIILSTQKNRSLSIVKSVNKKSSGTVLAVTDNKGHNYNVTSGQYLGKVSFRIAGLGKLAVYASVHTYNYFAIILAIILVLAALMLFIPSKKARQKKLLEEETENENGSVM